VIRNTAEADPDCTMRNYKGNRGQTITVDAAWTNKIGLETKQTIEDSDHDISASLIPISMYHFLTPSILNEFVSDSDDHRSIRSARYA